MPENKLIIQGYYHKQDGSALKEQNDQYEFFHNIYETQARSSKCDGFSFFIMGFLLVGATGHIICSIFNYTIREKLERVLLTNMQTNMASVN